MMKNRLKRAMDSISSKRTNMVEKVKNKEGFTLIELIVVMAIMAILVLMAAPRFIGYTKDADATALQADAKVLGDAAFQYNIDTEAWPVTEDAPQLEASVTQEQLGLEGTLKDLDEEALMGNYVKSIKTNIEGESTKDFYIIVNGKDEGTVIINEGVEDKEGNTHYGYNTKVEANTAE